MRRISFKDHFRNLYQLLIMLCLVPVALWFFSELENDLIPLEYLLLLLPFVVFLLLPTLMIHINYFLKNNKMKVTIGPDFIKLNKKGANYIIDSSTVKNVEYHLSYAVFDRRFLWLPWDYYRHVKIHLKDGTALTLTSLLMLDEDFDFFYRNDFDVEVYKNLFRLA